MEKADLLDACWEGDSASDLTPLFSAATRDAGPLWGGRSRDLLTVVFVVLRNGHSRTASSR